MLRDHQPLVFENFKGLWQRGDVENVPLDHFAECVNVRFIGNNVVTRDGIGVSQTVALPLKNIKRIYNYPTQTANTLIALVDNAGTGEIYHVVSPTVIYGPILSIVGMTDFGFVPYAGRGYITPLATFTTGDLNIQKGMQNQFLYVYMGDGTAARKAAGIGPTTTVLTIANGTGATDAGFHLFGVVYEYSSGYLSPIGQITSFTTLAANGVSFSAIQTSGSATVVKRHIVATKVINNYNGDNQGYQFYFIPTGNIENNTDTFKNNVTFFDADLLEDASHLLDNYTEISAGVGVTIYHNRLCLFTTYNDISIVLVSAKGEPEAISQIDGLLIVPLDGNPITNAQEMRDVLYVFKRAKTVAFVDNDDAPSTWPMTVIDNALGTSIHGIATVLDSGATSVDYLIVATFGGIQLFTGKYINPELTYKIQELWSQQDRDLFRVIQIVNDPIDKEIYCVIPDGRLLVGNYANGLEPKGMRWTPWNFNVTVNAVAIVNIDDVIIGADLIV